MGYGQSGVLVYRDENGKWVTVNHDNPLPATVNGAPPEVFITTIVSK